MFFFNICCHFIRKVDKTSVKVRKGGKQERSRRERERYFFICWFTPQIPVKTMTKSSETRYRSSTQVCHRSVWDPRLCCLPKCTLAGNWIGSRRASDVGCGHPEWYLNFRAISRQLWEVSHHLSPWCLSVLPGKIGPSWSSCWVSLNVSKKNWCEIVCECHKTRPEKNSWSSHFLEHKQGGSWGKELGQLLENPSANSALGAEKCPERPWQSLGSR